MRAADGTHPGSPAHAVVVAGLALLAAAVTTIVAAPAGWLAARLVAESPVRLMHAAGTVWTGSAALGVRDGDTLRLLPGRLAWHVDPAALATGRIALSLAHPAMDNAVRVTLGRGATEVAAGDARFPAAALVAFGAPFNTVRPGGQVRIAWSALRIAADRIEGRLDARWDDATSALSPVAPLGNFRLSFTGRGGTTDLALGTLRGPLQLAGRGSIDARRVRFTGSADAQPDVRPQLGALLTVLGKRNGDTAVLDWEIKR